MLYGHKTSQSQTEKSNPAGAECVVLLMFIQQYGAHGATHDVSGKEAMVITGTAEALNE